jgi:triosephosphate isomerase
MRKLFVAGNWKMNLNMSKSVALGAELKKRIGGVADVAVAVCPPFPYLKAVADAVAGSHIAVGAQNMYVETEGAYTGEVSGTMLLDVGCSYVILGHSERRHIIGEKDDFINAKVRKALALGLKPILCVGEKIEERRAGRTGDVVTRQVREGLKGVSGQDMQKVTIAYEPVWAIGTGENATPEQAEEVHALIRSLAAQLYGKQVADALVIQYGGSVKGENAAELMAQPDVDGALVGGASLTADKFVPIVEAARKQKKTC